MSGGTVPEFEAGPVAHEPARAGAGAGAAPASRLSMYDRMNDFAFSKYPLLDFLSTIDPIWKEIRASSDPRQEVEFRANIKRILIERKVNPGFFTEAIVWNIKISSKLGQYRDLQTLVKSVYDEIEAEKARGFTPDPSSPTSRGGHTPDPEPARAGAGTPPPSAPLDPLLVLESLSDVAKTRDLLRRGADFNAPKFFISSSMALPAVQYALQEDKKIDPKAIELIYNPATGININTADAASTMPPLSFAAKSSASKEILEAMINCGADPAIKDNTGKTPLHYAAASGKIETIAILIEARKNFLIKKAMAAGQSESAATLEALKAINLSLQVKDNKDRSISAICAQYNPSQAIEFNAHVESIITANSEEIVRLTSPTSAPEPARAGAGAGISPREELTAERVLEVVSWYKGVGAAGLPIYRVPVSEIKDIDAFKRNLEKLGIGYGIKPSGSFGGKEVLQLMIPAGKYEKALKNAIPDTSYQEAISIAESTKQADGSYKVSADPMCHIIYKEAGVSITSDKLTGPEAGKLQAYLERMREIIAKAATAPLAAELKKHHVGVDGIAGSTSVPRMGATTSPSRFTRG